MNSLHDPASLSITRDNRHQYLETSIAEASEADREIRQAEARGLQRRQREEDFKQTLKRAAWGVLGAVVAAAAFMVFLR